ncbi:hypothetical protein SDRG_09617 [Saprolegnia diclina VS20]|uniref:Uncharacterized protein n=1 Tax=Saprolegnia diclina (strain VS20) TaxID=1156394 RepID=T0QD35_SAPDV|nr:hypothetical protein SDRG_09617 [Saprolegnia diclina VS20]EQC32641.1 hypothetical protein SDRG_09617 [Saprolegnia diclina VS20]|eukprot:XP_008613785.1 hypothetical protein SDRG_09617 [Saprolegnia diclina VS20]
MGDNLFAGLNLDFNMLPDGNAASDRAAYSRPSGHKRHKSNPDFFDHFVPPPAFAPPTGIFSISDMPPLHPEPTSHGNIELTIPEPMPFSQPSNPHGSWAGMSFVDDAEVENILRDFLPANEPVQQHTELAQTFHAHQLQENVMDLKHKIRHERHLSNPDNLLHHAQQLRQFQHNPAAASFTDLLSMDEKKPPPPRKQRVSNRSTGLSMDMAQIALNLREENAAAEEAGNRKSYKCGRCGQPKVGHVCTLPDLRNNWSQVDLAITRGMKSWDANSKVLLTSKASWKAQHPDHKHIL